MCGNPVKEGEAGVLCDRCFEWFHATCQGISKQAIKALERFDTLAWLCENCKSDLKKRKECAPLLGALKNRFDGLEEACSADIRMWLTALLRSKSKI